MNVTRVEGENVTISGHVNEFKFITRLGNPVNDTIWWINECSTLEKHHMWVVLEQWRERWISDKIEVGGGGGRRGGGEGGEGERRTVGGVGKNLVEEWRDLVEEARVDVVEETGDDNTDGAVGKCRPILLGDRVVGGPRPLLYLAVSKDKRE
ncbi:hypothetical protein ACH5RR_028754 [Cinchona calisaya]|uniref:Uncharacterized protein n=1 Tax=Cinchona calisaya TaxID=153742 RepID=A0ABD2YPP8_9GENT